MKSSVQSLPATAAHNLRLERFLLEAADTLQVRGIPFMVLKGIPLTRRLYGRIDGRHIADNDILVRRQDAKRAVDALRTLGYEPLAPGELDIYLETNFQYVLIRSDGKGKDCLVDLHWEAFYPVLYPVEEKLVWDRSEPYELKGRTLLVPDRTMTVIHLAYHFALHGFVQRRTLVDFAAAWDLWHEVTDTDELLALATSINLIHALAFAFTAANDHGLLSSNYPPIRSIRAGWLRKALPAALLFHGAHWRDYKRRLLASLLAGPGPAVRDIFKQAFPPVPLLTALEREQRSGISFYFRYLGRPFRPISKTVLAKIRAWRAR